MGEIVTTYDYSDLRVNGKSPSGVYMRDKKSGPYTPCYRMKVGEKDFIHRYDESDDGTIEFTPYISIGHLNTGGDYVILPEIFVYGSIYPFSYYDHSCGRHIYEYTNYSYRAETQRTTGSGGGPSVTFIWINITKNTVPAGVPWEIRISNCDYGLQLGVAPPTAPTVPLDMTNRFTLRSAGHFGANDVISYGTFPFSGTGSTTGRVGGMINRWNTNWNGIQCTRFFMRSQSQDTNALNLDFSDDYYDERLNNVNLGIYARPVKYSTGGIYVDAQISNVQLPRQVIDDAFPLDLVNITSVMPGRSVASGYKSTVYSWAGMVPGTKSITINSSSRIKVY